MIFKQSLDANESSDMRQANLEKIQTFLAQVNDEYRPPLDTKVVLCAYAEKILDHSILFVEEINGIGIVGMVVLYCNNENEKRAYIPLVGVLPTYQRRGIAKRLMQEAIVYVRQQGYKVLGIHSNNMVAVKMYTKLGFIVKDDSERKYMELYI